MIAALLGALKAGKTYVPLDPLHPIERLSTILELAQAESLLTDTEHWPLAATLFPDSNKILNRDTLALQEPSDPVSHRVAPDTLAYLLYTSGSTGTPKGVMQNHRNVLHHIGTYGNSLNVNAEDRLTLLTSYGFDAAVMDIFGALLNGATLYPWDLLRGRGTLGANGADGQGADHNLPLHPDGVSLSAGGSTKGDEALDDSGGGVGGRGSAKSGRGVVCSAF